MVNEWLTILEPKASEPCPAKPRLIVGWRDAGSKGCQPLGGDVKGGTPFATAGFQGMKSFGRDS
jgi:hypothetical protein